MRRARIAAPLLLAPFLVAVGCDRAVSGGDSGGQARIQAQVQELVELCTPLDPTLTSDILDQQLHARRALIGELERGSREVGLEALSVYQEHANPEEPVLVRVRLLQVAAHAAPEDTRPLLETYVTEYGHPMDVRTESVRLLAETAPERALELLEPLVTRLSRTSTTPDDEFLIRGWVTACDETGRSPVPELADFLTNIRKQEAARHYAAQALGEYDDRLGIQALRAVLVESSGNQYLRRKAAQSLREVLPREEACAIFNEVAEREANAGFLQFLADMIERNCL